MTFIVSVNFSFLPIPKVHTTQRQSTLPLKPIYVMSFIQLMLMTLSNQFNIRPKMIFQKSLKYSD